MSTVCNSPLSDQPQHNGRKSAGVPLLLVIWTGLATLGTAHAWIFRYAVNSDGISYMDMAVAIAQGHWREAVNGYWSPAYPVLVGIVLRLLQPSPEQEAITAHGVNLVIYLVSGLCFHFFWTTLIRATNAPVAPQAQAPQRRPLPDWALLLVGYSLFVWVSLDLVRVNRIGPDVLLSGCIYLIAGLIARIRTGEASCRTFGVLGLVLSLSYLTKAVMFPLSFVILLAAWLAEPVRQRRPRVAIALVAFLAASSPYLAALSLQKGRPTFGDSSRIAYFLYASGSRLGYNFQMLDDDNPLVSWRGQLPGLGTPLHPKRIIHENPLVEEFSEPVGGSYPFWYDPSYWYDGVTPPFAWRWQCRLLLRNAQLFIEYMWGSRHALWVVVGAMVLAGLRRESLRQALRFWPLLLICLAGLGLYMLVLVETRYVGALLLVVCGVFISGLTLPAAGRYRLVAPAVALSVLLSAVSPTVLDTCHWLNSVPAPKKPGGPVIRPTTTLEIARGLRDLGIQPGDKIGYIGSGFTMLSYWASIARVHIVAELRPSRSFWPLDRTRQDELLEVFRTKAHVKAVVARNIPPECRSADWHAMGDSGLYVRLLEDPSATQTGR